MSLVVNYSRAGDVHTLDTGPGALGTLVIDQGPIPEDQRGGTAKQLLASSALYCYCAALSGALKTRNCPYSSLTGHAVVETDSNELGQSRVSTITISVTVTLSEDDAAAFERCAKVMRQGCLVTGSLHDGIGVHYDLQPEYTE